MRPDRARARPGTVIAATWLIGLGLIFLVRDFAGMSWGQAWPLFIVLVGVGTLVGAVAGPRGMAVGAWSLVWPLAWIAVGVLLLLSTTGVLALGPMELVTRGWPLVLVGIGLWFLVAAVWPWRRPATESLTIPLDDATEAEVRLRFGGGQLDLHAARPGMLIDGTFIGGVTHRIIRPGAVEIEAAGAGGWPWNGELRWDAGVTADVPLVLRVETGASRSSIDAGELRLRRLELKTGASQARVALPRAAGLTSVKVEAGAASVTIEVPAEVAARIRSGMALGSTVVDQARFPRSGDVYESPGFASAENRVEIEVEGGVGSVRVS
ncbi:MAG TPA: hypothetical protein VGA26_01185 [Candidatus Limnocylindria bacterium]